MIEVMRKFIKWWDAPSCAICGYYCLNKKAGCTPPPEYYEKLNVRLKGGEK